MLTPAIDPMLALGVFVSTAATNAVYVLFNASIVARQRWSAANERGVAPST